MYGSRPYTIANFEDRNFVAKIDSVSLLNTPRRIDKALEYAAQLLTGKEGRKIVVLLTAGKQTPGGTPLEDAVEPLRRMGVQTFVVAIGRKPDARELFPIIDNSKDLIDVRDPKTLRARALGIAKQVREKPSKYSFKFP